MMDPLDPHRPWDRPRSMQSDLWTLDLLTFLDKVHATLDTSISLSNYPKFLSGESQILVSHSQTTQKFLLGESQIPISQSQTTQKHLLVESQIPIFESQTTQKLALGESQMPVFESQTT